MGGIILGHLQISKIDRGKVGEKDNEMGPLFLLSVLMEEVGELAKALRGGSPSKRLGEELADVIFVTVSLANNLKIPLEPILTSKYVERSLEEIAEGWRDVPWKGRAKPRGGGER